MMFQDSGQFLPGTARHGHEHGIGVARFSRERVGPGLRPPGVALAQELMEAQFSSGEQFGQMMLVHIHDRMREDEIGKRVGHGMIAVRECHPRQMRCAWGR